ncbi:alpha/beta fold hydrolase [Brevibacillus fortis]|uniref:Alpha/beta hydrolase n=1 Tax=Brevibacillus fortis TaxID=2126352 RepID=A0A2P7ULW8_9BACL|nr:alpha/beta hydrolase [Brevibacillus fortis]PSJ87939.1 alpha/beta hydrolase [Brevibacillus fortis]
MEKQFRVGQVDVAYAVEGNGPALLLIHGTGGSYETTWSEMVKALSSQYTIITPNYSGSGNTVDHREKLELDDLVEQNVQAMSNEGIEQFHVVGYSLGAVIAAAIAAKYPNRVKSASLIAGWAESDLATAYQFDLWQKLFQTDRTLFAQFVIHTGFSQQFYRRFQNTEQLQQLAIDFAATLAEGTGRQSELDGRIHIRPLLDHITAPTLVIGLTHDRMVPVEQTKELASLIKGASYHEINSGHLVPWEQGETLIEEITRFLATVS